jgi:hypothetical protein
MDEHIGLDLIDHARLVAGVLTKLIERFDRPGLHEGVQPEAALALHQEAKALAGLVRDLVSEADTLLIASMDGERKQLIGDKTVEVRRAYNRTWDTPLLAGAVAACVLEGERIPEVDKVVEALVEAARLEWRVTAIDKLGLESDKYCTKELGRAQVQIT